MLGRGDVAQAWETAKSPGFWKLCTVAGAIGGLLYTYAFKPAQDWFTGERKAIGAEIRGVVDAGVAAESEERKTEDAVLDVRLSANERLIVAMWREHVRYVAAMRKVAVDAVVDDFDNLVRTHPADKAAEMALAQRRRR